ncbi:hypothetical protein EYF80_026495 [Liparis tanakae]|uniref:Uncharacterized protein n=1 Tax=Liparis tanakae TaxID=230148 RepID=A0A4Z2HEB5_9TELE|nr:hypothetical protein EYF80_026495 [Liparis tanakae]
MKPKKRNYRYARNARRHEGQEVQEVPSAGPVKPGQHSDYCAPLAQIRAAPFHTPLGISLILHTCLGARPAPSSVATRSAHPAHRQTNPTLLDAGSSVAVSCLGLHHQPPAVSSTSKHSGEMMEDLRQNEESSWKNVSVDQQVACRFNGIFDEALKHLLPIPKTPKHGASQWEGKVKLYVSLSRSKKLYRDMTLKRAEDGAQRSSVENHATNLERLHDCSHTGSCFGLDGLTP